MAVKPKALAQRKCKVCRKLYKPITRNQITCGRVCGKIRYEQLQKEWSERRRVLVLDKKCEVCGKKFTPVHNGTKYCANPNCKGEGLKRAIERQRNRRIQEKAARKLEEELRNKMVVDGETNGELT